MPSVESPLTNGSRLAQPSTWEPMRIPKTNSNSTLGMRQRRRTSEHNGAMATAAAMANTESAVEYDIRPAYERGPPRRRTVRPGASSVDRASAAPGLRP